ncbi:MAG: glycosyltransferase [Deinococcus sp.]|nr:glycosyltransferase [Deinococcus sp.]
MTPRVSIIIPAYNASTTLDRCLAQLQAHAPPDAEFIVVDDHSSDATAALARRHQVQVITNPGPRGPSAARNAGAQAAQGEVLVFVDADVYVLPDTLPRLLRHLEQGASAAFGSYTRETVHQNFASQFKNLQFYFLHQHGRTDAATFWAGCGAVRRDLFLATGGFDPERRYMEDADLGMRLKQLGARIVLDPLVQATHAKGYSWWELVRSDFVGRALAYTELILDHSQMPNDLSTSRRAKVSVALAWLLVLCLILAPWLAVARWAALLAAIDFLVVNFAFWQLAYRHRGAGFLLLAIPQFWLFHFYSGLGFLWGVYRHWRRRRAAHLLGQGH